MLPLPETIRKYVDETGLLLENSGLPRIAGQVLGWLQVCEPEQQSLDDLTGALGISKASASTTTRALEQIGIIERTIMPGDRRDFYRISHDAWHRFFQTRIETMSRLRRNADLGLHVLDGQSPERRERLERMRALYSFLEREIPRLLERFEGEQSNGHLGYADAAEASKPV